MGNSGIPWIDAVFNWCVIFLYEVEELPGITIRGRLRSFSLMIRKVTIRQGSLFLLACVKLLKHCIEF